MQKIINRFVDWFENGELTPFVILISIPHYAMVLARFDWWPVAAVLGFLLDMGHYRTIRAYLRGKGAFWMIVLSLFSYGFHFAFYFEGGAGLASLFFGGAVPIVIFALSFLGYAERWSEKARRAAEETPVVSGKAPAALATSEVSGNLPEPAAHYRTWRSLSTVERQQVAELSVVEIVAAYGVSERTARNWRQHET